MIGKEILNYVITSYIGQGGMGCVYLAENKYIKSQKVAIKVINSNMVNAFTKSRLEEEAEHLSKLDHPNIVHFMNYHIDEVGNMYLIMQYADGMSLEKYINTVTGLIVEDRICALFEPILDAVGYAHKQNIIHRDLKPNNIMIAPDGTPRILDFGIAKIIRNEDGSDNNDGLIMGTPSFMSPEQVKGDRLDARSDIYALGVILHQMLTGRAPYDTTTMSEHDINQKVVEEQLPRMKTFYSYVSDKLQKIVDKATDKDPKNRYQNCDEFKKALHNAVYPTKMPNWAKYAASVVALIMIGFGIYWWDYTRTKVYYYKDYVEQWGVPQGIGEIKSSQREHMERAYRFEYTRRQLIRVSHVNSLGYLTDDGESERSERPVDMLLSYTSEGKINSIKVRDRSGKVLYLKTYNSSLETLVFQYDDNLGTEKTMGNQTIGGINALDTSDSDDKGRISRWLLEYDNNGFVSKISYAGFQNVLVGDADNIYGRKYERDSKGRIVKETYLGRNGESKGTKWGLGMKTFDYSDNDNLVKVCYLTIDEKPAYDRPDGINIYELVYDENDNQIFEYHEDSQGELMISKTWGNAGTQHVFDAKGMRIKSIKLGIDGQPCYGSDGSAITEIGTDSHGYMSKLTFYDLEGNICLNSSGYASLSIVNDSVGNPIEFWMYDVDGSLVEDEDNKVGFTAEYDSVGNMVKYVMFGLDKNPVIGKNGYSGYIQRYNKLGALVQKTFVGKDMNPIRNYNDVMSVVYEYDVRGNMTKILFTDESGNKMLNSDAGYASFEYTYDDNGNITKVLYFDEKGNVTKHPDGNSSYEQTYDEYGNRTSYKYYDKDHNLVLVNGKAGEIYKCDERGNVLESYAIGKDGDLLSESLVAQYKYDEHDNQTEFAVFDKSGKRVLGYSGYHKNTTKYNSRNQQIEVRYYNTSNSLKNCDDGYSIVRYEYDDRGNNTKTSYFGTDEKPVKTSYGYANATYEYDSMNRVVKSSFYSIDNQPTDVKDISPVITKKYDKWGNTVFWGSEDGHGSYVFNPSWDFAIERLEYDIRGNILMLSFFNDKDMPFVSSKNGFHKRLCTFDNRGNIKTMEFFNDSNQPMVNRKEDYGYHKATYEYNSRNKRTEIAFYGTDGNPMLNNGYFRNVTSYNEQGKVSEDMYLGIKGEPVNSSYGFHKAVYSYTESGENEKILCYTASGSQYCTYKWDGDQWQQVNTWQSIINNQSTPVYTGEDWGYLVLKRMSVNGPNSFKMVIATPKSKYEMNDEVLSAYKEVAQAMAKVFTEDATLRRSRVYCNLELYDSSDRLLYSTTVY